MQFKATLLATAATAMVLSPAFAQDADDDDAPVSTAPAPTATPTPSASTEDTVVVRGIRNALQRSVDMKREADNIQDSISAEEVAEFPDDNVVDALARITGIQITREDGEGSGFTIRGISANRVEINGETSLGADSARDADLGNIPSGLLKNLVVVKTPTADMAEGSLGGTVQLNTRRPFDFRKPTLTISPSFSYGTESEVADPRLTVLATDRWDTPIGEIGALISANYADSNWTTESLQLNNWHGTCNYDLDGDGAINRGAGSFVRGGTRIFRTRFASSAGEDGILNTDDDVTNGSEEGTAYCLGDPDDFLYRPSQVYINHADRSRERIGIAGSLQWRPTDTLSIYANGTYNNYESNNFNYRIYTSNVAFGPAWGYVRDGNGGFESPYIEDATADENGTATSVTFGAGLPSWLPLRVFSRTGYNLVESDAYSYQIGGNWRPSDSLRITGQIGLGHSLHDRYNQGLDLRSDYSDDNTFTVDVDSHSLRISTGRDLTDTTLFRPVRIINGRGVSERDEAVAKFDVHYWLGDRAGPLEKLQFGGRFTESIFNRKEENQNVFRVRPLVSELDLFNDAFYVRDTSDFLDNVSNVSVPGEMIAVRPELISDFGYFTDLFGIDSGFVPNPGATYEFSEWSSALYGRANFKTQLFGKPVDGNIGVRVVGTRLATDTNALSTYIDPETGRTAGTYEVGDTGELELVSFNRQYQPLRFSHSYWNTLPSANFRMKIQDDFFLRIGVAKTMKRYGFYQLRPTTNINVNGGQRGTQDDPWNGNRGSFNLEPRTATQIDVSFEKYFGKRDLVSLAFYNRQVENYLIEERVLQEFDTFPNADSENGWAIIREYRNGDSAYVRGFESSVQYTFDQYDQWWGGFGLLANYTLALSEAGGEDEDNLDFDGTIMGLPGLSKHSYNLSAFYENYGFNARLSYNWRSDWRNGAKADGRQGYRDAVGTLDFSSGYRINDNYRVYFNGRNLTQTVNYRYFMTEDAPQLISVSDRRFIVGLNAKF